MKTTTQEDIDRMKGQLKEDAQDGKVAKLRPKIEDMLSALAETLPNKRSITVKNYGEDDEVYAVMVAGAKHPEIAAFKGDKAETRAKILRELDRGFLESILKPLVGKGDLDLSIEDIQRIRKLIDLLESFGDKDWFYQFDVDCCFVAFTNNKTRVADSHICQELTNKLALEIFEAVIRDFWGRAELEKKEKLEKITMLEIEAENMSGCIEEAESILSYLKGKHSQDEDIPF